TLPETPVVAPAPEPIAPAPEPVPVPPPAPEPEIVPAPVSPPTPQAEPEELPPPGPPETTPDFIEAVEDQFVTPPAPVAPPAERQSWFSRLTSGLRRSSDNLTASISSVFTKRKLDAATLDELEDVLIQADLGLETAMAITETLRKDRFDKDVSGEDVRSVLASEVEKVLGPVARPLDIDTSKKPFIKIGRASCRERGELAV